MLQVAVMAFPDMTTIEELLELKVTSRLIVIYIQTTVASMIKLTQLPKIAHGKAAHCVVTNSGVWTLCAHSANVLKAS